MGGLWVNGSGATNGSYVININDINNLILTLIAESVNTNFSHQVLVAYIRSEANDAGLVYNFF